MKKSDIITLALISVFGIAAVVLSNYGDTVGVSMMVAAGIALSLNYFYRKLKFKNEVQTDEMKKRISSEASEFALFVAISTIGVLTIVLHFNPTMFDVFEVLAVLLTVILVSKIAFQYYYSRMKDEIGF